MMLPPIFRNNSDESISVMREAPSSSNEGANFHGYDIWNAAPPASHSNVTEETRPAEEPEGSDSDSSSVVTSTSKLSDTV